MLIKTQGNGFNQPLPSEITDKAHYEKRRDLLKMMATGVAGGAMATWASRQALAQATASVPRPGKLAALSSRPSAVAGATTVEKAHSLQRCEHVQQFLRIWHRQVGPRGKRPYAQNDTVDSGH